MGLRIGIDLALSGGGRARAPSGVVLQIPVADAAGAVANPNPAGTGDVSLGNPLISAVAFWNPTGTGDVALLGLSAAALGAVANPNPTGTGAVSLSVPTIAASGTALSTLFAADFTTQSTGGGSVSSYGLSFSRASSGHSVQTGTSAVATGGTIGNNDVPRFGRRLDGDNVGLVIEESRTNTVQNNRDLTNGTWTNSSATVTSNYATSPDGNTLADRVEVASGNFGMYAEPVTTQSQPAVGSMWVRRATADSTHQFRCTFRDAVFATFGTATASWQRIQISATASSGAFDRFLPADGGDQSGNGGTTAGARDTVVDFCQCETAKFATEAIITASASVTRSGERLWLSAGGPLLAADGSLRFYVKLRPKGSSSQYANDMRFWHVDANNHAEVVASTGAVKITIGGTAYTTATTASWAANDLVEFWIAAGGGDVATVVKYRVNGGSVTTLSTGSPPTQGDITISGAIDLLCNGTSSQFTAWVEKIETYPTGASPSGF